MASTKSLPFLGIIAVGGSMAEAAIAYHNAALGNHAVGVTNRDNSFLFMSNANPSDMVLSNPLTGELDLVDVPQALSAVQFQSKSSAKVAARYNVCAGNGVDGKDGCGTHIIYDSKDAVKFCPICNESLSSEKSEDDISGALTLEELGDSILSVESSSNKQIAEDSKNEDISFNDVSDDEDDEDDEEEEDDYTGEASSDLKSDINLLEMSDEEIADFEKELTSQSSDNSDVDSTELNLSDKDLMSIRDELIREAKQDVLKAQSSGNNNKDNGDFAVDCSSLVAISREQTKALNKFRAMLMSKAAMSVVASSTSGTGFATLAKDAKVFHHDITTGDIIDGVATVKPKSTDFIESLSSTADYSIADMYQCSNTSCGIFIVTSASDPHHCPMCASDLQDPTDIEDAIIPVGVSADDDVAESKIVSESSDDNIGSEEIDDFDLETLLNGEDNQTATSTGSSEEGSSDTGDELTSDMGITKKSQVSNIQDYKNSKESMKTKPKAGDPDNSDINDFDAVATSDMAITAQKTQLTLSLLAESIRDDAANTNTSLLNIVYCGSLSTADTKAVNHVSRDDTWTAFYNGMPIAYATVASSIAHKDIFHDPAFAEASLASAKVNGIRQALLDMGFRPYVTSVRVKDNINTLIASQVIKAKSDTLADATTANFDYNNRLLAALSTAAIGINRGFFRNLSNPIRTSLVNALTAAGVRNPENMIDHVFSAHADGYHKILLGKAKEIVSKPLEIQNEITAAVLDTNYSATASTTSSFNTAAASVEDRLSAFGKPTDGMTVSNSASMTSADTAGNGSSQHQAPDTNRMIKVVSTLGRRR